MKVVLKCRLLIVERPLRHDTNGRILCEKHHGATRLDHASRQVIVLAFTLVLDSVTSSSLQHPYNPPLLTPSHPLTPADANSYDSTLLSISSSKHLMISLWEKHDISPDYEVWLLRLGSTECQRIFLVNNS